MQTILAAKQMPRHGPAWIVDELSASAYRSNFVSSAVEEQIVRLESGHEQSRVLIVDFPTDHAQLQHAPGLERFCPKQELCMKHIYHCKCQCSVDTYSFKLALYSARRTRGETSPSAMLALSCFGSLDFGPRRACCRNSLEQTHKPCKSLALCRPRKWCISAHLGLSGYLDLRVVFWGRRTSGCV